MKNAVMFGAVMITTLGTIRFACSCLAVAVAAGTEDCRVSTMKEPICSERWDNGIADPSQDAGHANGKR